MHIDIQYALDQPSNYLPDANQISLWANTVLNSQNMNGEVTVRIVTIEEITLLNENYRHKPGPTNVLSFPADLPDIVNLPLLGDIILCAEVINFEAKNQNKTAPTHWAHMVVHGILHLLGFDHITDTEAKQMETLETKILSGLGYADPYNSNGQ